jgi:hypothetical protein
MIIEQSVPPKRMPKNKKSSFYHVRWNKVGINEERAAEILDVSVEDIKRFDIEGAPIMAERLLLLWDQKRIGIEGWEGFIFVRGVLRFKSLRWTPKTILDFREHDEEILSLRNEINRLYTLSGVIRILKTLANKKKANNLKHPGTSVK